MTADTVYIILKKYIYQVKTESQLRLLFNRLQSNENTSDRIPKIFHPNSEVKAMIFLKYTHLLMPISVTNKILVCCKVTLYHSGFKKCFHLRPQLLQITIMFTQLSIQNQKYLKSFRNSLRRSHKENGKVSNRITCDFSNTAHTI